jgi:hypothetical protein
MSSYSKEPLHVNGEVDTIRAIYNPLGKIKKADEMG